MTTTGTISSAGAVFADNQAQTVVMNDGKTDVTALYRDYVTNGPNPEYRAFEYRINYGQATYRRTAGASVWEFINDAVDGSGGFANGQYLFPFKLELDAAGLPSLKYLKRQEQADYDNFAGHICNTPWDVIVGSADLIDRSAKEGSPAATLLAEFWSNCDTNGTAILDFLEYPHKQARRFGTGIIVMDRPPVPLISEADNFNPENRPWVYAVPSKNVVHWEFDDDGDLAGIVILEPKMLDEGNGEGRREVTDVRVWTKTQWAVFRQSDGETSSVTDFLPISAGNHNLGEVPVVACYNDSPDPRRLLAHTEMLDVARLAQTVYNMDSEARETERKCGMVLTIPVKSTDGYTEKTIVLSNETALAYDGEAGAPAWISPDLTILERLNDRRKIKKLDGYQMAGLGALAAITEAVKTASGYHAEVEFAKTERRIARHASMLEAVEKRLARLYLKFYGISSDDEDDLFSITYPHDYGVRDMDALVDRTSILLGMNLGQTWDSETLEKLARAQFPRMDEAKINAMVADAVKTRADAAAQQQQLDRVQAMAKMISKPPLKPKSQATADRQYASGGGNASQDS